MNLLESIKKSEGFSGMPYKDTQGIPTIGFGTRLPLSKQESEILANMRLTTKKRRLNKALSHLDIANEAWEILYEMSYQLGVNGLLKFKDMIKALEKQDYKKASVEMLDSLWYRQMHEADMRDGVDSENRAERLAHKMSRIK